MLMQKNLTLSMRINRDYTCHMLSTFGLYKFS